MKLKSLLLVMVLSISLLVGCGSQKGSENQGADNNVSNSKDGKTVITIWSKDRHDASYVQKKVEEYNAKQDEIEVVYTLYTDNYKQAIDMAIQSNELPDILVYQGGIFDQYGKDGHFADLYPMMDDQMKEFFKDAITEGYNEIDGKLYFIPTTGSTCRLFYNKEIFDRVGVSEPPKTLEEMVEVAKKITTELKDEGIYGFAQNLKSSNSALARSMMLGLQRETGLEQGYNFKEGKYEFEKWADELRLWKELVSPEIAFPGCESLDIDPLRTQFAAGKIGMYFSYTGAEPGVYENQFPMDSEKWDAAPIPTVGGKEIGKQAYSGASGYLLNANSSNLEKAFQVYKDIFTTEEYLIGYYEGGFGVSIIPAVLEKANPSENYKNKKWLRVNKDTDALLPKAPHNAFQAGMVVEGQDLYKTAESIYYGEEDIESTLKDLSERYNAAYQKAIENGSGYEIKIENYDPMNPTLE